MTDPQKVFLDAIFTILAQNLPEYDMYLIVDHKNEPDINVRGYGCEACVRNILIQVIDAFENKEHNHSGGFDAKSVIASIVDTDPNKPPN